MIGQIIADFNRRFRDGRNRLRYLHPPLNLITIRQPDNRTIERSVSVRKGVAKPRVVKRCRLADDNPFCRMVPSMSGQRILFTATLRIPAPAGSRKLWTPRSLPATRQLRKFPRSSKRTSSRTLRYKFSSLPSPPRPYGAFGVQSETYAIS